MEGFSPSTTATSYLLGAYERSDEVFVGITNPDPTRIKPEPVTRSATSRSRIRGRMPSGC